jgi:hypothetical protein
VLKSDNFKTNEEILEAFKIVLPYINSITPDDMAISINRFRKIHRVS